MKRLQMRIPRALGLLAATVPAWADPKPDTPMPTPDHLRPGVTVAGKSLEHAPPPNPYQPLSFLIGHCWKSTCPDSERTDDGWVPGFKARMQRVRDASS